MKYCVLEFDDNFNCVENEKIPFEFESISMNLGSSLIEMKSISTGPNAEHISQMIFYSTVINNGWEGYLAGSKGNEKVGPFTAIRYYFSNEKAAKLWEKMLKKTFDDKVKIYVGTTEFTGEVPLY